MIDDGEAGAWPVDDLYCFLQGSWSLYRTMNDLRLNMPGVLQGDVLIQKKPGGGDDELVYREKGQLILGDHREIIDRYYLYKFPDRDDARHLGDVHFEHGGLFYGLDLSTGFQKVVYQGENDTYRGTIAVHSYDVWSLNWFVTGPSMEIIIDSRYERTS